MTSVLHDTFTLPGLTQFKQYVVVPVATYLPINPVTNTTTHIALAAITLIATLHVGWRAAIKTSLLALGVTVIPIRSLTQKLVTVPTLAQDLNPGDVTPVSFSKLPSWIQGLSLLDVSSDKRLIDYSNSEDLVLTLTLLAVGILFKSHLASKAMLLLSARRLFISHGVVASVYKQLSGLVGTTKNHPTPPATAEPDGFGAVIKPCLDNDGKDLLTVPIREALTHATPDDTAHGLLVSDVGRAWVHFSLISEQALETATQGLQRDPQAKLCSNLYHKLKQLFRSGPARHLTGLEKLQKRLLHMYMMKWEATNSVADRETIATQLSGEEALTDVNWDERRREVERDGENQIPKAYLDNLRMMLEAARAQGNINE